MTKNTVTNKDNEHGNVSCPSGSFACGLSRALFRLLPFVPWQAFIMNRHMNTCPRCLELQKDFQYSESGILVTPGQTSELPALWPVLREQLHDSPTPDPATLESSKRRHPSPRRFHRRRLAATWAFVATIILLPVIIIVSGMENHEKNETGKEIMVKSVKIESHNASFYIFQSEDPDKLIVWTQKN